MERNNDLAEIMRYVDIGLTSFPNILSLIKDNDIRSWENKIGKSKSYKQYLLEESNFNILTLSYIIGYEKFYNVADNPPITQLIFRKLESYLDQFPDLLSDKSFINKIKNLEGLNFLSTLSELSLASYFLQQGFSIGFETRFIRKDSGKRKDVDVTVQDKKGNSFHLEAYMPTEQSFIDGFFDPHSEDHHLEFKIGKKLLDKFGTDGITGLNGQVLLAVNIAMFDMIRLKLVTGLKINHKNLITFLPPDTHGFLLFHDDFATINSFQIIKLVEKE